jgi:uncharacterized protein (DUF4415 family)
MSENKIAGAPTWVDPDDAPELTDDWFEGAELREAGRPVRRGRPRAARPKQPVSIRLSVEVLEHFKGQGPGWQGRIDAVLRDVVAKAGQG